MRLTSVGLGLVATATLAVAGCAEGTGVTTPGASGAASPSASASTGAADSEAAAALARSTTQLGTTSFKVTMTSGSTLSMTGLVDPANGVGDNTLEVKGNGASVKVETLLVGQDLYLRLGGLTAADKWMHVDVARLPEGANVGIRPGQLDAGNAQRWLESATDVRQVDARTFQGNVDLTKVTGVTGVDRVTIDGYGEAAKSVPFRATLDDQARLSTMTVDLPAVGGQKPQPLEIAYSDYGTTVAVQKPAAAAVTEAPQAVYDALGG